MPWRACAGTAWYCLRWRIEDWHRVLKSGCGIEALAHKTRTRLERAIAIRLVTDKRIMLMTLLDVLGLGSEQRMNLPGTLSSANWSWRFAWPMLGDERLTWFCFSMGHGNGRRKVCPAFSWGNRQR